MDNSKVKIANPATALHVWSNPHLQHTDGNNEQKKYTCKPSNGLNINRKVDTGFSIKTCKPFSGRDISPRSPHFNLVHTISLACTHNLSC